MTGGDSEDVIGMDVDAVHGTGQRIHGRSADVAAAAGRIRTGMVSAHDGLGHAAVKKALLNYLTDRTIGPAAALGPDVSAAGHHVANVAAVARAGDDDAADALAREVDGSQTAATGLRRQITIPPSQA